MADRRHRGARSLFLLGTLMFLPPAASASIPDACRRMGEHTVTIRLRLAPHNRGTLVSGPGGQLRLKMSRGSDPCGGMVNEIFTFRVKGSREREVFAIRANRALERGSFTFLIHLGGATDRLRLRGTNHQDRITYFVGDTSDGAVEMFRWRRVGSARVFGVNRIRLVGRGEDDALRGNPAGPPRKFPESSRRPMRISGGSGDDTVVGGRRNDRLAGWSGNDFILGGKGNDTLLGGGGLDDCSGGGGVDTLVGCE